MPYLIGFNIEKDVDFVIYGKENCKKIKNNIKFIREYLGATEITNDHIKYQINKYKGRFSEFNNFDKMLCNKWSSIQIKDGILSTIRFAYKENEVYENYFDRKIISIVKIKGKVIDDFGTNFCPRTFTVNANGKNYIIATYFWIYQSCVKNDMEIEIIGNLRENNIITLDSFDGIRIVCP